MMHPTRHHAFSLVELSIVLVILGLLVGGILSGQSLIRAAELRSVATQYNQFFSATQSFRDKYFALPGDMTNATSFWGAQDGGTGNTASCKTTTSPAALTCNGNGDGMVNDSATSSYEEFRYWQQLANAGLIEGQYKGIPDAVPIYTATTANVPRGKMSNSLWFIFNWATTFSGHGNMFDGTPGNTMWIGNPVANAAPGGQLMRPEELWNIDTKLDDGKPGIGKVITYWSGGCTTAANSAALTADYALSTTTIVCNPLFVRSF